MTTETDRIRAEFDRWYEADFNPKPTSPGMEFVTKEILFAGWSGCASRPVEVTEEMVINAAAELANPTVPTVFSRCIEEDGKRVYVVGYANDDRSEVIRYRGNFGPIAESDHFDLENEVLARAVLSAALSPSDTGGKDG